MIDRAEFVPKVLDTLRRLATLKTLEFLAKRVLQILFSHLGLLLLVIAYCAGGAYLFVSIESGPERQVWEEAINVSILVEERRADIEALLTESSSGQRVTASVIIGNATQNVTIITPQEQLDNYTALVEWAIAEHMYPGHVIQASEVEYGWTFPSALLFTVTIVTTIGYGHVSPNTALGQIVVIVYSILGMPLLLMFLANIGDAMATMFRVGYYKGLCWVCWRRRKTILHHFDDERNQRRLAWADHVKEVDDERKQKEEMRRKIEEVKKNKFVRFDVELGELEEENAVTVLQEEAKAEQEEKLKTEREDEEVVETKPSEAMINVPVSLCLVIITIYLIAGSLLFATWNDWSYVEAAYFSFVTLSTIGFGDYVPGYKELGTVAGDIKFMLSTAYILLGLSVLSMCLNLMMEEMIAKLRSLAMELGIIKSDQHE